MNEVATLISTVGFPIACCIFLGWFIKYITDKYTKMLSDENAKYKEDMQKNTEMHYNQIQAINDQHKEEMNAVTQAINNNTLVIQKLCDNLNIYDAITKDDEKK